MSYPFRYIGGCPFVVYKGTLPRHYKGGSVMNNEQWNEEWLAEEEEDEDE